MGNKDRDRKESRELKTTPTPFLSEICPTLTLPVAPLRSPAQRGHLMGSREPSPQRKRIRSLCSDLLLGVGCGIGCPQPWSVRAHREPGPGSLRLGTYRLLRPQLLKRRAAQAFVTTDRHMRARGSRPSQPVRGARSCPLRGRCPGPGCECCASEPAARAQLSAGRRGPSSDFTSSHISPCSHLSTLSYQVHVRPQWGLHLDPLSTPHTSWNMEASRSD